MLYYDSDAADGQEATTASPTPEPCTCSPLSTSLTPHIVLISIAAAEAAIILVVVVAFVVYAKQSTFCNLI